MFAINDPCHEDWNDMTPQERGRHCAKCDKEVVDFTALDPDEGLAILAEAAAQSDSCKTGICGRVNADQNGRLQLGASLKRRLLSDAMAGMLAMSVLGGCYQTPSAHDPVETESQQEKLMGDICVDPDEHAVVIGQVIVPPKVNSDQPIKGELIELRGEIEVQPE